MQVYIYNIGRFIKKQVLTKVLYKTELRFLTKCIVIQIWHLNLTNNEIKTTNFIGNKIDL